MQNAQQLAKSKRRFWITGITLATLSIVLLACFAFLGILMFQEIGILENGIQATENIVDANVRVLSQTQRELLRMEVLLASGANDQDILHLHHSFINQRMNEVILPYQLQVLGSEELLNVARELASRWATEVDPVLYDIIEDPTDDDETLRSDSILIMRELELGFNSLLAEGEIYRKLQAGRLNDGAKVFLNNTRLIVFALSIIIAGYLAFVAITGFSYFRFDRERNLATQELTYLTHEMRKLSLVAQLTNNIVIITDTHGFIEWVNDAFVEQTGYSLAESKGKKPGLFLQGANTNQVIVDYMRDKLRQGLGFSTEIINYKKSGEEYWISIEVQPSYDEVGNLLNFIAVESDITEQKQSQAQLEQYAKEMGTANKALYTQQNRLRSLLNIATQSNDTHEQLMQAVEQGATSLNMEVGIVSHVEDGAYTIMQCFAPAHDLVIGMTCDVKSTLCQKTVESRGVYSVLDVSSTMKIEKPCFDAIIPSAYIGTPIRIGDSMYGTLSFITETTRETPFTETEHDFVDLMGQWVNVTLERSEVEHVLRQNLERERELGQLKSRFISMASHEFRTPLTTILSIASYLEMAEDKVTPEKRLNRLSKIQGAVNDMTQLLNEVLLFGKAEANRLEYQPKYLDIVDFSTEIIQDIQASVKETHQINYTNHLDNPRLFVDEKLMRQIITNLLTNAVKYSPEGSTVSMEVGIEGEQFYLIVKDQGIGIPENDQKHLFEPFHRSKNVQDIPGTGLGLAITKKAVEKHNGTIHFESKQNQGTSFKIFIPNLVKGEEQNENISH